MSLRVDHCGESSVLAANGSSLVTKLSLRAGLDLKNKRDSEGNGGPAKRPAAVVPVSMLGMDDLRAEGAASLVSPRATDVRIEDLPHEYEDFLDRTPLKFGGNIVGRVTLPNIDCTVGSRNSKVVKGFGSMPPGNVRSFPSKVLSYGAPGER